MCEEGVGWITAPPALVSAVRWAFCKRKELLDEAVTRLKRLAS
ncbi:hypothetical protein ACFW2T_10080 [Streptomyces sp. NPDC058892]